MTSKSNLTLPMLDVSNVDSSKLNLAGYYDKEHPEIANSIDEFIDQRKKFADSLEERYKNPNWFKVAAGLAKPQLGGFMASLGSGAEALGDWQEQQRAVAPTIAKMRAENSLYGTALNQQSVSSKILSDWKTNHPNEPYPPALISKVEELVGKEHPLATSAKTFQTTTGTAQEQSLAAQRAKNENPFYQVLPGTLPEDWAQNTELTRKKLQDELVATGKFTPEALKLLPNKDLLDTHQQMTKTNAELKLKNAQSAGDVIAGNSQALQDLTAARDLASSPKLEKMLGIGSGQNAVSALFGWIAAPTEAGKIGALNEAAAKLAQKDPQAYADFQVLQKTLSKNLADARATIQNPSVGAQNLLSQTQPSVLNSKLAIVKMLDLIAHEKSSQTREGVLRQTYRGRDPAGFESDPSSGFAELQRQIQEEKRAIEKSPTADSELPKFYNPYSSLYTASSASAPSVKTKPQASSSSSNNKSRITNNTAIEDLMRKRGLLTD